MRIDVRIEGSFEEWVRNQVLAGERAVTRATRVAGSRLKTSWRSQISRAQLGRRLANTIRARNYPQQGESINAAALVFSKAPQIVGAHERGALVRSPNGFWLTIPTEAARQIIGRRGRGERANAVRIVERKLGRSLRVVHRAGRPSLLVADGFGIGRTGRLRSLTRSARGRQGRRSQLKGRTTVVMFTLVRQVKLQKRLDLARDAERAAASLPGLIVANWKD